MNYKNKDGSNHKNTRHGLSRTRFWRIWDAMKKRCSYKKHPIYSRYGGRGIKVCDGWLKFDNFKQDMYEKYIEHCQRTGEENTTLDRIDNDGNYELKNCRWSTWNEQMAHTKNSRILKLGDLSMTLIDWSRKLKISSSTLIVRIDYLGWSIEKALTKPLRGKK